MKLVDMTNFDNQRFFIDILKVMQSDIDEVK